MVDLMMHECPSYEDSGACHCFEPVVVPQADARVISLLDVSCGRCGGPSIPTGSCRTCLNCGESTGCG